MQKKLIYISLLISLLSLTFACQTETFEFEQDSNSVIELADGRLRVPIHLHIPEREVVETKTTPNDAEKAVKTVDVCVFDADGKVLEKVVGEKDPTNPLCVFAKVLPRNVPCKVQVYVNIPAGCREAFNAAETLADMQKITMSNTIFGSQSITANGLPMVSDLDPYTALNSTTLKDKVAKLKFAYARIDGTNKATGFTLASCQGLNFRQDSYLIERTPLASPVDVFNTTATDQLSGIYLFESPGSTPTDLLIEGTNTGFGKGYYKIRIAYGDDKKTYDIRRGVRYAVNITSVKGPGYASAEEAIANEPSNVEVDITVDDPTSSDITISNGGYYLGLSNSEYIIYADEARGVIATTLSFKVPETVTNANITIEAGKGITLSANQPGLNVSDNGHSATIQGLDNTVKTIPIRINVESAASTGSVKFRIGDIVKELKVVKKEYLSETSPQTIQLADLGLTDYSVIESQSDRIVVNTASKTLTVNPQEGPSMKVLSTVKCLAPGDRGNVVIAVKRKVVNVVYYEKYTDGKYGLFLTKDIPATLDNADRVIVEAGYGVVDTDAPVTKSVTIKDSKSIAGISSRDLFDDYEGVIYGINQDELGVSNTADITYQVTFDNSKTNFYIYRNFAKGVYSTSSITDGGALASPYVIRTPKQFRNINRMAAYSSSKFFKQERDLNFADENIGGLSSFNSSIVSNAFSGEYNGSGKRLENLTLNNRSESMALFKSNWGVIKDVRMHNINVIGGSNSACLVGINRGNINTILIDGLRIYAYGQFVGGITGHNSTNGYVNNCMVMALGDEGGSGRNTIYSTSSEAYIGGIAGCNHRDSRGIENVCVLDLQRSPQRCFVHSSNASNTTAGIVGYNEQILENAIYLAMPPYGNVLFELSQFPICRYSRTGYDHKTSKTYYLRAFDFQLLGMDTGIGRYTTAFVNSSLDLPIEYWNKITGYPYPYLKSFPIPRSWPQVNDLIILQ